MSTATNRTKSTEKESEDLARQVDAIRQDLSKLSKSVSSLTRSGISDAQGMVRDKADEASEFARESVGEVQRAISRNPLQASLLAVGLGFLIGMMARR